jgi:hypothetical protein
MSEIIAIHDLIGKAEFKLEPTKHSWQFTLLYSAETDKGVIEGKTPVLKHPYSGIKFGYNVINTELDNDIYACILAMKNDFNKTETPVLVFLSKNNDIINKCVIELNKTIE